MVKLVKLLILAACVSGCAVKPQIDAPVSLKAAQGAETKARTVIAKDQARIPPSLLKDCRKKTNVPKIKDLDEDVARDLWNEDRYRLDRCYGLQKSLSEAVRVRGKLPIPQPQQRPTKGG